MMNNFNIIKIILSDAFKEQCSGNNIVDFSNNDKMKKTYRTIDKNNSIILSAGELVYNQLTFNDKIINYGESYLNDKVIEYGLEVNFYIKYNNLWCTLYNKGDTSIILTEGDYLGCVNVCRGEFK